MNDLPLISVIIPIFNTMRFLSNCLDSVIAQTYENIEIILINDGSTDDSLATCLTYAKNDSRIHVIDQTNQGQASARNAGILSSHGRYISFIDSDDTVECDYIAYLWNLLNTQKASISICGYAFCYENDRKPSLTSETFQIQMLGEQAAKKLFYQKHFDAAPWAKLIDAEIVKTHLFPNGRIFEDFVAVTQWMLSADNVVFGNAQKLNYFVRSSSTMNKSFTPKRLDLIWATKQIFDLIESKYPRLIGAMRVRRYSNYCQALLSLPPFDPAYVSVESELMNTLKRDALFVIVNPASRLKNKLAAFMLLLFGSKGLRYVSQMMKKRS